MSKWNRRQFLSGLLAAAGAGATSATYAEALSAGSVLGGLPPTQGSVPDATTAARPESIAGASRLPLAQDGEEHALQELLPQGLRFGRWRVVAVHPVKHGAVPVVVESQSGRRFQVDVLRRDRHPQAKHGIGETRFYALFLANNGRGNTPTVEEQGMGLLWLAALLRPREHRVRPGMLLTQRERVRMFPRGRFDVVLDRAPDQDRRAAAARASATPSTRAEVDTARLEAEARASATPAVRSRRSRGA